MISSAVFLCLIAEVTFNERISEWVHLYFYHKRFSRYLHLKFEKEVMFLGRFSPCEITENGAKSLISEFSKLLFK